MNVGQAITAGMRADRRRDHRRLVREFRHYNVMYAWLEWGWAIHGNRHLGQGGDNYPYGWYRQRWDK